MRNPYSIITNQAAISARSDRAAGQNCNDAKINQHSFHMIVILQHWLMKVVQRSLKSHFASGRKAETRENEGNLMKVFLRAATAPAAALLAAIAFGAMLAPEASAGEFCRRDVTGHMTSCGFDNMAQCQAASAGIGGDCFRDPSLNDSGNALAYHPKSSRSKGGTRTVGTVGKAANTNN